MKLPDKKFFYQFLVQFKEYSQNKNSLRRTSLVHIGAANGTGEEFSGQNEEQKLLVVAVDAILSSTADFLSRLPRAFAFNWKLPRVSLNQWTRAACRRCHEEQELFSLMPREWSKSGSHEKKFIQNEMNKIQPILWTIPKNFKQNSRTD